MAESLQAIVAAAPRGGRPTPLAGTLEDSPDQVRHARSRRVARDLVELWRLQNGAERAEAAVVDVAALLTTVCEERFEVALSGPPVLTVVSDPRRLSRIVLLALDNARLHGAPPVTVEYDATSIAITDCGKGFATRVLDLVPAPFITADRSHGRGVGLGLAIAYRQAELIGARLVLSNAAHGGAVVRLKFLAAAEAAA